MKKITKRPDGSVKVETVNTKPSRTQQQFKDETDVNLIVAKYEKTGQFARSTAKTGQYADFSEIKDYQSMLNTVIEAQNAFQELDAKTRYRFDNDPAKLIAFMQDASNYDEGVKLGIYEPKKAQEPIKNELNEQKTAPSA